MTPPIYRARRKDNSEWVEGYLYQSKEGGCTIFTPYDSHFIDPSTLAISFEDMTDKNDKRIFAALNKNGAGGDMFKKQYVFVYIRGTLYFIDTTFAGVEVPISVFRPSDFEVTGIYEEDNQ